MPEKVRELTSQIPGWTIDYEADAAYLQLRQVEIAETLCFGIVNIDVDADGNAVGIELMTLTPDA